MQQNAAVLCLNCPRSVGAIPAGSTGSPLTPRSQTAKATKSDRCLLMVRAGILGLGHEAAETVDEIGIACRRYMPSLSLDRKAAPGRIVVELAGKSTYTPGSTIGRSASAGEATRDMKRVQQSVQQLRPED
jgi:hypothetical protein